MIDSFLLLVFWQVSAALQFGDFGQKNSLEFLLEIAASIFSLLLFSVTMYAWSRRGKQPTLFIVSIAFLVFFSKLLTEILPIGELHDELVSSIMDFVVLGIFFLALLVKPKKRHSIVNSDKKLVEKRA